MCEPLEALDHYLRRLAWLLPRLHSILAVLYEHYPAVIYATVVLVDGLSAQSYALIACFWQSGRVLVDLDAVRTYQVLTLFVCLAL